MENKKRQIFIGALAAIVLVAVILSLFLLNGGALKSVEGFITEQPDVETFTFEPAAGSDIANQKYSIDISNVKEKDFTDERGHKLTMNDFLSTTEVKVYYSRIDTSADPPVIVAKKLIQLNESGK